MSKVSPLELSIKCVRMSCEKVLPSNLVPIKDVNDEQVQRVGRIAVQMNNERRGHHFVYKRVVNGLFDPSLHEPKFHIIVIEVINDDGIPWSYVAKVDFYVFAFPNHILYSFEDVFKDFNKH